jgi:hypothetical protein
MATRPLRSVRERSVAARMHSAAATAVTSSLILYLAAVAVQRAWALLNSDVGHLVRRLH